MENNQNSETVRAVTEEDQTGRITQKEPIRSQQVESYRSTNQGIPVISTSQVDTVRTYKPDPINRTSPVTRIVYWLLSILEALLALRLVLKLLGANTSHSFVTFIYDLSKIFVAPFEGIFKPFVSGIETSTLIAILVYALVGWGLAKLIAIVTNTSSVNR